jgi:hypothetical protein
MMLRAVAVRQIHLLDWESCGLFLHKDRIFRIELKHRCSHVGTGYSCNATCTFSDGV